MKKVAATMISGTLSSWDANAAMALTSPGFGRGMRAIPFGLFLGALMLLDDQHPLLAVACAIASAILFDVISRRVGVPAFMRRGMMATVHEGSTLTTYTCASDLQWERRDSLPMVLVYGASGLLLVPLLVIWR
jgi:hypothetical protein